MAGIVDNFELGAAGLKDLAARAFGYDSHAAADLYAEQTAAEKRAAEEARLQEQGISYTPDSMDAYERDETARLRAEALAADAGGKVVSQAAHDTAEQVAQKVKDAAKAGMGWLPWVAGGAVALGTVLLVWRVTR